MNSQGQFFEVFHWQRFILTGNDKPDFVYPDCRGVSKPLRAS
jgi:hypothetical protein